MTLRESIAGTAEQLASTPDLASTAVADAALLVLGTLGLPRTLLYTDPSRPLSDQEQTLVARALHRRLNGEPMQYILGIQHFFGIALAVSPAVLIPRPETEILVEAVLDRLPADRVLHLADIGTGSGAIAIALAVHRPLAQVVAVDVFAAALELARRNAHTHGVADRVTLLHGDLLAPVPAVPPLDAVVSNPPYIPRADLPTLHRQVRDYEPHRALFPEGPEATADDDGLGLYRRLLPEAAERLTPGGLLAVEFGAGQKDGLRALLEGWKHLEFLLDLQRIPRVALARSRAGHSPK